MHVWLVDDDRTLLEHSESLLADEIIAEPSINVNLKTIRSLRDFEAAVVDLEKPDSVYPDLIFLDLRFKSVRDGYAALDMVKHHDRMSVRSIPIIMFSSTRDATEIRKTYRKSANAYVEKGPDPYAKFRSILDHWRLSAALPTLAPDEQVM